jgi:hypothetical protein
MHLQWIWRSLALVTTKCKAQRNLWHVFFDAAVPVCRGALRFPLRHGNFGVGANL